MARIIAKVQITSVLDQWWLSDMANIFADPDKVQIISAIEYNGGLYLIYTYEE